MTIEPRIRETDQALVKAPFLCSRLVAGHQDDRAAIRIEGERNTPYPLPGLKPKFLHVRVLGAVKRIHVRASKRRPTFLEGPKLGKQLKTDLAIQVVELPIEFIVEFDAPRHREKTITDRLLPLKPGPRRCAV
jgi:hypothetical protein